MGEDNEQFKKIVKYILNTLTIINFFLVNLAPIWEFNANKVIATIAVVMAGISTYLLGGKAIDTAVNKENDDF